MSPIREPRTFRRIATALAPIIALAALLSLYRLGGADVCGFNEAVEGVFVQQMVEHGALLFPLDNSRAPLYKPPLFHWTATALDHLIGAKRVTPLNLRMTAALYAIAGVALTMWFAYDFLGLAGATVAGLVLCGSYQYLENARVGRVDMTLCFFETLALFAFAWWLTPGHDDDPSLRLAGQVEAGRPARDAALRYLMAGALGLAVLAKGPVGILIPAIACGLFILSERRFGDLRRLAGPLALAIIIGSSWYAACYFGGHASFLHRQLSSENLGRFLGLLGTMAPWYYLKPLLLNSVPLSLIAPFAVFAALRTPGGRAAHERSRADVAVRLFAIFWLVTVIFFSIAAYKRRAYLLPLWPVAAVMIAWWADSLARSGEPLHFAWAPTWSDNLPFRHLARRAVIAVCAGAILFNFFYLPRKAIRDCGNDSMRATATQINRIVGRDEPLYSYKLGDEPATLLFYLDRDAPPITTRLGDAPPGYVIAPADVWRAEQASAPEWTPVFSSSSGNPRVVLLRHGAALARSFVR